jgi:hypothetical protein
MDSAVCFVLANDAGDQRLDARRFDLDVDHGVTSNGIEDSGESWNLDALRQRIFPDVGRRKICDATGRDARRVDYWIVVNDDQAICCRMNVELDRIRAELDRADERWYGVLGQGVVRSTVRDLLGRGAAGRLQAFPRVVVLGTMSAKL